MSALDDIAAATLALNNLTVAESAEKARIDAAVAAALAAIAATGKTLYLDAVAGLDTNDGSSPTKAVATPQAALALIGAGQASVVLLMSDVTLTAPLTLAGSFITFGSYGVASNGTGGTIRKMTLAPSSGINPGGGLGCSILSPQRNPLYFINVNVAVGALTSAQSVAAILPSGFLGLVNCAMTLDPGLQVPVISPYTPCDIQAAGLTLPAGYGGKLFAGVPAGANPNSYLIRTNITAG